MILIPITCISQILYYPSVIFSNTKMKLILKIGTPKKITIIVLKLEQFSNVYKNVD